MNNINQLANSVENQSIKNIANFKVQLTSESKIQQLRIQKLKVNQQTKQVSVLQNTTNNFTCEPTSPYGVISRKATKHWHFLAAQDELTRSFELIKVLRQHQKDNRWTLLIAPSHIPDKALLECCSVDLNHVLVVREKQITSMFSTIEKALKCNTCSAVVAWSYKWHTQLDKTQLQQLSKLADISHCHIYAFDKDWGDNDRKAPH